MNTKILTTTKFRQNVSSFMKNVVLTGQPLVLGRKNSPEIVMIPYPVDYNKNISEISNMNAYSQSFDFLKEEPNIYNKKDLKKLYV